MHERDDVARVRRTRALVRPHVLVLDDLSMRELTATEAQDLCEILEERSLGKSNVFTTQLPLDHWAEVIADVALIITIAGESYRGVKARKLAVTRKES